MDDDGTICREEEIISQGMASAPVGGGLCLVCAATAYARMVQAVFSPGDRMRAARPVE